jgi:hypothetical protein
LKGGKDRKERLGADRCPEREEFFFLKKAVFTDLHGPTENPSVESYEGVFL